MSTKVKRTPEADAATASAGDAVATTTSTAGESQPQAAEAPRPKVRVILPKGKRPGILKCGDYAVGVPYEVTATVADDLIARKGFEVVTEAPAASTTTEET